MASRFLHKLSRMIPFLRAEGYEIPRSNSNDIIYRGRITLSGSAPHTITFASLGLPDMYSSTSYHVSVQGPHGDEYWDVDDAGNIASAFVLNGGADTEVVSVIIMGKPANAE